MKRFTSAVLVVLLLSLGATALADINPQQMGHVAFLQSQYGPKKTEQILDSYRHPGQGGGAAREAVETAIDTAPPVVTDYVYEIPTYTTTATNDLGRLAVGERFEFGGLRYIAGQYTYIGSTRVLVAYLVDDWGFYDTGNPRFFYVA